MIAYLCISIIAAHGPWPLLPTVGGLSQKMDGVMQCDACPVNLGWTVGFIQNGCAAKSGPVKKRKQ